MTIFFQHVGQRGGASHFPLTIGTREGGLTRFTYSDIEPYLANEAPEERRRLQEVLSDPVSDGFQIWGAPSGARSVLRGAAVGDWLLLLESDRPGGQFYYGGRILHSFARENFELSAHLWGEAGYPLILLLNGQLTNYGWEQFSSAFGYGPNWRLQGRTYRLTAERLTQSAFLSDDDVIAAVLGRPAVQASDDAFPSVLDPVELTYASLEGRKQLREHIARERDSELIRRFKKSLKTFECSVCGFDFEKVYGEIGRGFVEGHHLDALGLREGNEETSVERVVPVCSNCHRMLHRRSPPYTPDELSNLMIGRFETRR